jgi:hypothetical protein
MAMTTTTFSIAIASIKAEVNMSHGAADLARRSSVHRMASREAMARQSSSVPMGSV